MKDGQVKIESKVPLPPKRQKGSYPFGEMTVGDSFFFHSDRLAQVYQAAATYKRRSQKPWGYTCRKQAGGYRLWRIK